MAPQLPYLRLQKPSGRDIARYALVWCALALVVWVGVTALRLPERMDCSGMGRHAHCRHGLLSPELWRRP